MSEFTHQTGQIDPTQHEPTVEVTEQQIENVSAADIFTVARSEYDRLDALQFDDDIIQSEARTNGVQKRLKHMEQVMGLIESYAEQGSGESFSTFLDLRMERAEKAGLLDAEEVIISTKDWLNSQEVRGAVHDILRGRREQVVVEPLSDVQPQPDVALDSQAEEAQEAQELENARRSIEHAHNIELFNDIVRIGKGRTLIYADVAAGFQEVGDGNASSNKPGQVHIPIAFREVFKRENKPVDWRQELNEVVMFSDVIEQDKREVLVQKQSKGRFGRTHTSEYTKMEAVPNSQRPAVIRNELTGQDEPAVRFRYKFDMGSSHANRASYHEEGELPKYQEFGGYRNGQSIAACVDLPKSIADQLQAQIRKDPQSVRILAEQLFLANNNGAITEEYWYQGKSGVGHAVRPPYEQLPKDWNIAIVANQDGDGASSDYTIDRVEI